MLCHPFTVTIPADTDAIYAVVDDVTRELEAQKWLERDVTAVQLALIEAMTNAIRHGCRGDRTKQIECSVGCGRSDELVIVVRDSGAGFDAGAVPDPLEGANQLKPSGRGIFLMRALMDQVMFVEGGRKVQMRKRRTQRVPEREKEV